MALNLHRVLLEQREVQHMYQYSLDAFNTFLQKAIDRTQAEKGTTETEGETEGESESERGRDASVA